jgi:hypothetical protein
MCTRPPCLGPSTTERPRTLISLKRFCAWAVDVGLLQVYGKRNKHRQIPLSSTVREVLEGYLPTLPADSPLVVSLQQDPCGPILARYQRRRDCRRRSYLDGVPRDG